MQSLVIVIILLSLIGLYINLGTITDLRSPELKESTESTESLENLSADQIADKIVSEIDADTEFDKMGNSLKVGDGLSKDKQIINLNVDSAGAPNTRPYKWTTTTKKEINKYGLTKSSLSYKNNFPYDVNYLADTEAKDRLRSSENMARNPKAQAIRSQIVLPKDETQFKEGFNFMNRAIAIIRNQVANENKILPDVRKVDSQDVTHRAAKTIHRVDSDYMEVKVKPEINTVKTAIEHNSMHKRVTKFDPVKHSVDTMKSNYNFK